MTGLSWQAADVLSAVESLGGLVPTGDKGPVRTVEGLGFSRLVASRGLLELVDAGAVQVEGAWLRVVGA